MPRKITALFALFVCFRWIDAAGTLNFTDMLERVPEAYRAQAERVEIEGGLGAYPKFTPAGQ